MEGMAGYCGPSVRSDCFVRIIPDQQAGCRIVLKSKVESLYGTSIRKLVEDILQFYGIRNVTVEIEDTGALPYVIAARVEAAIRQLTETDRSFLLPLLPGNIYPTLRHARRRSRLYLPGDNPKLIINAGLYRSDGIILDLEDSVAPEKKDEARLLVRNALRNNDWMHAEKMVRINQLPLGFQDLEMIVGQPLNLILIPKCESPETVEAVNEKISALLGENNTDIWLMPIIESAAGVHHAYEIAAATGTVAALAIGLEDYTADIGAQRTPEGTESFYARSVIVNASRAAGVQPIDSVFSDFTNDEQLFKTARASRTMGFEGMGCIHPGQIPTIHCAFDPEPEEIEKAKRVVWAFEKAALEGKTVVTVGTKMVDPPVVKRAQNTIDLAIQSGLTDKAWRENYEG